MEGLPKERETHDEPERKARQGTVPFTFAGRSLWGVAGQPISVALWANGVKRLDEAGTSGIGRAFYCGIGHCYACHVVVDGVPFVRACITPLAAGMDVQPADSYERPSA